jgi:hypothetical protein
MNPHRVSGDVHDHETHLLLAHLSHVMCRDVDDLILGTVLDI